VGFDKEGERVAVSEMKRRSRFVVHISGTAEFNVEHLWPEGQMPSELSAHAIAERLAEMGTKVSILEDMGGLRILNVDVEYPIREPNRNCTVIWKN
jgi:hypothetical protein